MIGIFNAHHYEDVLVTKVHKLFPKSTVEQRMSRSTTSADAVGERVHILKFFLHMSGDEQAARLDARVADPVKLEVFGSDYQTPVLGRLSGCI